MQKLINTLVCLLTPVFSFAQLIAFESGQKWGFKNSAGEIVVSPRYAGVGENGIATSGGRVVDVFNEGFAPVTLKGSATGIMNSIENGQWGFIDEKGKEVVPLRYDAVSPFHNGYAVVSRGGKKGLVDKSGKEVIPAKYERVQEGFSEGLAMVSREGRWGYVNEQGSETIAPKFYAAQPFSEGLAAVAPEAAKQVVAGTFAMDKYGFIDKAGKLTIPAKFGDPLNSSDPIPALQFHQGQAKVMNGSTPAFIDKTGSEAGPSLVNGIDAIYLDSYKGFPKTQSDVLIQRDSATGRSLYRANGAPANGKSAVMVAGASKVFILRYANAPEMATALQHVKDFMKAVAAKGWSFKPYMLDYSADKAGNVVLSVMESKNGLPNPRTTKMRLTETSQGFELQITGNQ